MISFILIFCLLPTLLKPVYPVDPHVYALYGARILKFFWYTKENIFSVYYDTTETFISTLVYEISGIHTEYTFQWYKYSCDQRLNIPIYFSPNKNTYNPAVSILIVLLIPLSYSLRLNFFNAVYVVIAFRFTFQLRLLSSSDIQIT